MHPVLRRDRGAAGTLPAGPRGAVCAGALPNPRRARTQHRTCIELLALEPAPHAAARTAAELTEATEASPAPECGAGVEGVARDGTSEPPLVGVAAAAMGGHGMGGRVAAFVVVCDAREELALHRVEFAGGAGGVASSRVRRYALDAPVCAFAVVSARELVAGVSARGTLVL